MMFRGAFHPRGNRIPCDPVLDARHEAFVWKCVAFALGVAVVALWATRP